MSSGVNKRTGKPQVELYRPGSGPLRKSAFGEEDSYGDQIDTKNERNNFGRDKKDSSDYKKVDAYKLSDDFDKLSVCSNSSYKKERSNNQNLSGSVGNLSCERRRTKKPEAAIYVPPKPSIPMQTNNDNKRYSSRNYSNSHRSETMKRDGGMRDSNSFKRDCESSRKDHWTDTRSYRDESEQPTRRPNDPARKPKKSKKRNGRGQSKEDNSRQVNGNREEAIIPLMEIKFDYNPLKGRVSNLDTVGHETSGYTTTDGESEKDPPYSMRGANTLPNRGLRQTSEPRYSSLNSIQVENLTRDSRSVEPDEDHSWSNDRFNQKPPVGSFGRRGNKQTHPKYKQHHPLYESLPPRLRKKYMEDNGFQEPPVSCSYSNATTEKLVSGSNPDLSYHATDSEYSYSGPVSTPYQMTDSKSNYLNTKTNFISTTSEDPWDGSCSVTFQGSNPGTYIPNVTMLSHPPPNMYNHIPSPAVWSQTLPNIRTRGRGRVPHDELERERIAFEEARIRRSLTPNAFEECKQRSVDSESLRVELLESEKKIETSVNNQEKEEAESPKQDKQLKVEPIQNKTTEDQLNENNNAVNKQISPVPPKSPQDLTFKKTTGTGMVRKTNYKFDFLLSIFYFYAYENMNTDTIT